jgi:nitrite reductase/ring-hydroxylating ferredoxin subunit
VRRQTPGRSRIGPNRTDLEETRGERRHTHPPTGGDRRSRNDPRDRHRRHLDRLQRVQRLDRHGELVEFRIGDERRHLDAAPPSQVPGFLKWLAGQAVGGAVGGAISAKGADGKPIVIARPETGKVVAFSAVCTHRGCSVTPNGNKLVCPCHRSQFDALTGAALTGPASSPLPAVTVKVDGTDVVPG